MQHEKYKSHLKNIQESLDEVKRFSYSKAFDKEDEAKERGASDKFIKKLRAEAKREEKAYREQSKRFSDMISSFTNYVSVSNSEDLLADPKVRKRYVEVLKRYKNVRKELEYIQNEMKEIVRTKV